LVTDSLRMIWPVGPDAAGRCGACHGRELGVAEACLVCGAAGAEQAGLLDPPEPEERPRKVYSPAPVAKPAPTPAPAIRKPMASRKPAGYVIKPGGGRSSFDLKALAERLGG